MTSQQKIEKKLTFTKQTIKAFAIIEDNNKCVLVSKKIQDPEKSTSSFLSGQYNLFGGTKKPRESIHRTLRRRIWHESNGIYELKKTTKPELIHVAKHDDVIYKFYILKKEDLKKSANTEKRIDNTTNNPITVNKNIITIFAEKVEFLSKTKLLEHIEEYKKQSDTTAEDKIPITYQILTKYLQGILSKE